MRRTEPAGPGLGRYGPDGPSRQDKPMRRTHPFLVRPNPLTGGAATDRAPAPRASAPASLLRHPTSGSHRFVSFGVALLSAVSPISAGAAEPEGPPAPVVAPQTVLHVYGPGGPAPAMREAAAIFGRDRGISITVTAGPTSGWSAALERDGDLVYSGSEAMMADFLGRFADSLRPESYRPLYLRPAALLVRPGNPRHIAGFRDLLKAGMRVQVVNGAGQVGLWEDIAGRDGSIATLARFRSRIAHAAPNSAEALKAWQEDRTLDAWLIFPSWAIDHPGVAEVVPLEPRYRLYRDCGVALTRRGADKPLARAFVAFLASARGQAIFARHGWMREADDKTQDGRSPATQHRRRAP